MTKQGHSDREVDRPKVEPTAKAINPARVAQMGIATAYPKDNPHLGRGFSAPHDAGRHVHPKGSQGRR